jgi:hypothetical protein
MSSTNRGYKRHKSDYYVTPVRDIENFINYITNDIPNIFNGNILDPCAGGDEKHQMSYPNALLNKGINPNNITTVDIRKDSKAMIKENYLDIKCPGDFNCIITNPPFKIALPIIKKALDDVNDNGYVIMLLRLNFFGSQKRFSFWNKYMPKYVYVHHKRMSFTDKGGTDSIEYCHMVWKKDDYPKFSKIKVI